MRIGTAPSRPEKTPATRVPPAVTPEVMPTEAGFLFIPCILPLGSVGHSVPQCQAK